MIHLEHLDRRAAESLLGPGQFGIRGANADVLIFCWVSGASVSIKDLIRWFQCRISVKVPLAAFPGGGYHTYVISVTFQW